MRAGIKKGSVIDPWLSIEQAKNALGIQRYSVAMKALHGELEYQRVAGKIVISRASVERLRDEIGATAAA